MERTVFGYTYAQWMDPARLAQKAQIEWDRQVSLEDAFDLVKPKDHWKGPISADFPAEKRKLVESAIINFAGGGAVFTETSDPEVLHVEAPGYWANGF